MGAFPCASSSQFNFIAKSNRCDAAKTAALASYLRGKACAILDREIKSLIYAELTAKLELRFGETLLA